MHQDPARGLVNLAQQSILWTKAIEDIMATTKSAHINCLAGINRSTLFVAILLLCYYTSATVMMVMNYLKKMRPCCEFVHHCKGGSMHPEERQGKPTANRAGGIEGSRRTGRG